MKIIKLTKNQFAQVDDSDFKELNKHKWYCTSAGYAVREVKGKTLLMHRVLLDAQKPFDVDHIDGNPLNNQRENIRIVTHAQNTQQRVHLNKNNSSGVTGICWWKRDGKWRARIYVNGKEIHLGLFAKKEDAITARKDAEKKYYLINKAV